METELCHFVSFGPNTPSNAVQGPVPHRHLLAGFGVSFWRRVAVSLVGTYQHLQPCAEIDAWLFPVTTLLDRLRRPVDIKLQVLNMLNLCSGFSPSV